MANRIPGMHREKFVKVLQYEGDMWGNVANRIPGMHREKFVKRGQKRSFMLERTGDEHNTT